MKRAGCLWTLVASTLCVALALVVFGVVERPNETEASASSSQAISRNCDGGWWSFRAQRLWNGAVGFSYAYDPTGTGPLSWSPPVSIGGNVASNDDIAVTCIVGKVWVLAKLTSPVDGTAQLYERHGYPTDLANGTGGGWFGDWYHWR